MKKTFFQLRSVTLCQNVFEGKMTWHAVHIYISYLMVMYLKRMIINN